MDNKTRLALWDRDNGQCRECGGPAQEVHHIQFKQMGGRKGEAKRKSESMDNLMCICNPCHRRIHG